VHNNPFTDPLLHELASRCDSFGNPANVANEFLDLVVRYSMPSHSSSFSDTFPVASAKLRNLCNPNNAGDDEKETSAVI
jgi:hypothetical protein